MSDSLLALLQENHGLFVVKFWQYLSAFRLAHPQENSNVQISFYWTNAVQSSQLCVWLKAEPHIYLKHNYLHFTSRTYLNNFQGELFHDNQCHLTILEGWASPRKSEENKHLEVLPIVIVLVYVSLDFPPMILCLPLFQILSWTFTLLSQFTVIQRKPTDFQFLPFFSWFKKNIGDNLQEAYLWAMKWGINWKYIYWNVFSFGNVIYCYSFIVRIIL